MNILPSQLFNNLDIITGNLHSCTGTARSNLRKNTSKEEKIIYEAYVKHIEAGCPALYDN